MLAGAGALLLPPLPGLPGELLPPLQCSTQLFGAWKE